MGLLQNGFKDTCGVFRIYGAGLSNGALPQQLQANYALTGMRRNLTAGEGIVDDKIGLPLGYLAGGSYQLPQKPGMLSARAYELTVDGSANGLSGLPGTGSSSLGVPQIEGAMLPLDDTPPARTANGAFAFVADGIGELRMSGAGSTAFAVSVTPAELVGILGAAGSVVVQISVGDPILGAKADGQGEASLAFSTTATMLPSDDSDPARTASAAFSLTGTLTPYAIGSMVGSALPYTELSPQSLAGAVWSASAGENNQAGTMGNKLNTASSGGVDLEALAEAVWSYEE